jgi:WG repeat protein
MPPLALLLVMLFTTIAFSQSLKSQESASQEFEALFPIVTERKWGLIDRTGRVIVAPRFDELGRQDVNRLGVQLDAWQAWVLFASEPTWDDLVGVHLGKTWGFVDRDDEMVIAASFDGVGWFGQEGLAAADLRGKWGFIDRAGRFVIEPQFDYVYNFACGLAHVQKGRGRGEKWGLIDTSGRFVLRATFDQIWEPCYWALMYSHGHPERSSRYNAESYNTDLIGVVVGKQMGYVNRQGEVMIEPAFVRQTDMAFREGLKRVRLKPGDKDGYIDRTGGLVISPQFDSAGEFFDGRALVRVGGRSGYIDRTGAFVDDRRPATEDFSDGLASFRTAGKVGFIDRSGKVVIEARFDAARGFAEGRAAICLGGRWGFIDRTGTVVIEPRFERANDFKGGSLALVREGTRASYIDPGGTVVFSAQVPGLAGLKQAPCGSATAVP